jgi:NADH dehydrogenase FAD-containing subunit
VLRLDLASTTNDEDLKSKAQTALQEAHYIIEERLKQINGQPEARLRALRLSILFNLAYWFEFDHQYDQANNLYK